jgi:hypothetical protein
VYTLIALETTYLAPLPSIRLSVLATLQLGLVAAGDSVIKKPVGKQTHKSGSDNKHGHYCVYHIRVTLKQGFENSTSHQIQDTEGKYLASPFHFLLTNVSPFS